jgi:hypothetical protein
MLAPLIGVACVGPFSTPATQADGGPSAYQTVVSDASPAEAIVRRGITWVRLANLVPAVVFADGNILSYRTDLPNESGSALNAVDGSGAHRRAQLAPWGRSTAIDACAAGNVDDTASDHQETITLFFTGDSVAGRASGEYTLWRQTNDATPIPLVRHVVRDRRHPFLEYRYIVPGGTDEDSLGLVPSALLPISLRDTVASVIDVRTLRAVEWRFLVVADPTSHTSPPTRVHLVTSLPAIGELDRRECRATVHDDALLVFGDGATPHRSRNES